MANSHTDSLLETYSNPARTEILFYLAIHNKISLTDLSSLMGKSKPTILRHIKKLKELNLVNVIEGSTENKPSDKKPHFYELNRDISYTSLSVKDLQRSITNNEENVEQKINNFLLARITFYKRIQHIINLTLNYSEKMNNVMKANVNSPDNLLEILNDHSGFFNLEFLDEKTAHTLANKNNRDYDGIIDGRDKSESIARPFLHIRLLVPIERLLNTEKRYMWDTQGDTWPKID